MTSRERILNTLKGLPVDRVPIWLRDEFNIEQPAEKRESGEDLEKSGKLKEVGSGEGFDEFSDGWTVTDPHYNAIKEFHRSIRGDILKEVRIPGNLCNRLLVTPPGCIRKDEETILNDGKRITYSIDTPKGSLTFINEYRRNNSTVWGVKHAVENREDLEKILSIPYTLEEADFSALHREEELLSDRGVHVVHLDTPFVAVSGLMAFQDFLLMCGADAGLLRELCDIAYERIDAILDLCLANGIGPIIRLMGSEQATPPMNSPKTYEKFIFEYESRLVKKIHEHGLFAAVHCHGKVAEVLPMMLDMRLDMLDPVEAPPSGDITFSEAKNVVDGRMTLAGNIQFDDLETCSPAEIENQVKAILTEGRKDHVILNTTASPITFVSERMRDNYLTMIRAGIEYGSFS